MNRRRSADVTMTRRRSSDVVQAKLNAVLQGKQLVHRAYVQPMILQLTRQHQLTKGKTMNDDVLLRMALAHLADVARELNGDRDQLDNWVLVKLWLARLCEDLSHQGETAVEFRRRMPLPTHDDVSGLDRRSAWRQR